MQRMVWYEKLVLGLALVALAAAVVEWVRPEGDGLPFAFFAVGLSWLVVVSVYRRRHRQAAPVAWYELVLIGLSVLALAIAVAELVRPAGGSGLPFALAAAVFTLLAFTSRLIRPSMAAKP